MKFSFVIPAYNEEGYLDGCLRAIKRQNCGNYEIIVSYSPSSDKTLRIARKFGASVVKVPRCTPAKARNAGARRAGGDYIVFVDADVELPVNFLRSTVRAINSGASAVGYSLRSIENDAEMDSGFKLMVNPFNRCFKTPTACLTVKRSVFEMVGGYDENMEVNEDIDISRRLARVGKILFAAGMFLRVSSRRFYKMGKASAFGMYLSWFVLGFIAGGKIKYFHVSDIEKKISREA